MVASQILFFFSLVFLCCFIPSAASRTCPALCGRSEPTITFPFRLNNQSSRCGWPGFELSCNKSKTFIGLPSSSGKGFVVQRIEYESQTLSINDPDLCLPKRFLDHSFTLSGSPFEHVVPVANFTFLNCSTNQVPPDINFPCLSGENYTVVALPASRYNDSEKSLNWSLCSNISTVAIPVQWPTMSNPDYGILLTWSKPDCKLCEERGGVCRFKKFESQDRDIRRPNLPTTTRLPRAAKYGIIMGAAIPGLLCFIGLGCYLCGRVRAYYERRRFSSRLISSFSPTHGSVALTTGLDGQTIESFPKTKLGESRRLPNPNDNTCPICLGDYQPEETLRTIPQCKHYFHADCIDEWLKMNTTCPLCRNSPESSGIVTPCTPSTFSSPSSSLLSVP